MKHISQNSFVMERKGLKNKGKTFTFQAPLSFKLGSTFFILKMMTKHSTQSRNFNEHKRRKKKENICISVGEHGAKFHAVSLHWEQSPRRIRCNIKDGWTQRRMKISKTTKSRP